GGEHGGGGRVWGGGRGGGPGGGRLTEPGEGTRKHLVGPAAPEGGKMIAVLDDVNCTACWGRHTLSLPDDATPAGGQVYEYECPASGKAVRVAGDWDVVDRRPPGSVTARPAGSQ